MNITVRTANQGDVTEILYLMRKLAIFQGLEDKYEPHSGRLRIQMGSTGNPRVHCFIAFSGEQPIGYALYYLRDYASFRSKWKALHLEDLFVEEAFRVQGVGQQLLGEIAKQAIENNVEYVSLEVHQENVKAYDGYVKLGAEPPPDTIWQPLVLGTDALKKLAQ